MQHDYVIGRRIVIYGATGSGKTTLSRRLGAALGLPVIELDAIRHDGDWDATYWPQLYERVEALVAQYTDGWVCEGNYGRVRDVTLSRADTLISLDLPWRTSFWRLFKRTMWRGWSHRPLYAEDGPHESLRMAFFSRHSILLWSITNHRRRKRTTADAIANAPEGCLVYRLRTSREVEALLRAVEASPAQR